MGVNGAFDDIRPYRDHEVSDVVKRVVQSESFTKLMRYVYPNDDLERLLGEIAQVTTIEDFQIRVAYPAMRKVVNSTTTDLTISGLENISQHKSHLFISNHRDIILDSAIMNILLYESGMGTFETAIGSNLLKEEIVRDLTKLNKNFTVIRNAGAREMYENSVRLSAYIHDTIIKRNSNVWIAQKEGRTKDGIDKTQPGLLKMLGINCEKPLNECFRDLRVTPVAISYEFDPCDVLKVPELEAISKDQKYQKQEGEDYHSILTGLMGPKGRVHLSIGEPLDTELDQLKEVASVNDKLKLLGEIIDRKIYSLYRLWPSNYIALDRLNNKSDFSSSYSEEERKSFNSRIDLKMAEAGLEKEEDLYFLLNMYANPVKNALQPLGQI